MRVVLLVADSLLRADAPEFAGGACKTLAFATQGGCLTENRYCVRLRLP
jgi:hypothetical protein